jgi:hypothetical protein
MVYITLVNVTNTSGGSGDAYIDLGVYYNTSVTTTLDNIKVGKYNYSAGWVSAGGLRNGTSGLIVANGLATFSYFGAGQYVINTSSTSTPSSTSGTSQLSMTITSTQTCPGDQITVTTTSGVTELRLLLTNPYEGLVTSKTSNADGKTTFTLTKAGTYEIHGVRTSYNLGKMVFDYTMCSGGVSATPTTTPVTPSVTPSITTPPITSTTIPPSTTTPSTTTPTTTTTATDAQTAISSATSLISTAKSAGKNVIAAESKLAQAQTEYTAGNYATAETLAKEATTLAQNAQAQPTTTTTPITTTPTTAKTDTGVLAGLGILGLLIVVIVVVAIAAGVYFFVIKKDGAGKKFKGFKRV